MASSSSEPLEGASFMFEPKDLDRQDFLNNIENPAAKINEDIIKDVVAEIQPAFAEDGVPSAVLEMLQNLWIQKLQKRQGDTPSSSPAGGFHGFPDLESSTTDDGATVAEPVSLTKKKPTKIAKQPAKKSMKILQLDGPNDSSDSDEEVNEDIEDEDDDDDDNDSDDDIDGEDEDQEGEGAEDEPLGSGDDISEGDPSDLFNTENVVVCQYDKITRTRNKWKFHLKDGIMNLNGKDYVFQKATGEAEW